MQLRAGASSPLFNVNPSKIPIRLISYTLDSLNVTTQTSILSVVCKHMYNTTNTNYTRHSLFQLMVIYIVMVSRTGNTLLGGHPPHGNWFTGILSLRLLSGNKKMTYVNSGSAAAFTESRLDAVNKDNSGIL